MKNQYVGDINDYHKYALLRALSAAHGGALRVCWMLTAPDERKDGRHLAYLSDANNFGALDPPLYEVLDELISREERSVQAVQAARIFARATYHSDILTDLVAERERYFARFWRGLGRGDLLFFDPDNGFETASVRRGCRNSSKYLYWEEVAQALGEDRSLCVYQHFPRLPRALFLDQLLDRVLRLAPDYGAFAVRSAFVAFVVCAPAARLAALREAAKELAARPGARLTCVG